MDMEYLQRTKELLENGEGQPLAGGDLPPFVLWPPEDQPDARGYIEGSILEIWEGEHGPVARIILNRVEGSVRGSSGSQPYRRIVELQSGDLVNLDLGHAMLSGIGEDQVGETVHVAFRGWRQSQNEDRRYRMFDVIRVNVDD